MVIPRFVYQALKEQPVTIYGTGKQTRCFLHVKDVVNALISLMQHPKAVGDVFNVGSQEEITIENLAKEVIELTKSKSKTIYIPYDQAYEEGFEDMHRRVPDITKVKNLINFNLTSDLEGILKDVIEFCRNKVA
jgi:UDP-glucose 4-epimerase